MRRNKLEEKSREQLQQMAKVIFSTWDKDDLIKYIISNMTYRELADFIIDNYSDYKVADVEELSDELLLEEIEKLKREKEHRGLD